MALDAALARIAGVVVNGAIRDLSMIREAGCPTWYRHRSVERVERHGGGWVNKPVLCAGRDVHPGDIIIGDEDGVLLLPVNLAAPTIDRAEARRNWKPQSRRMHRGERLFNTQRFGTLPRERGSKNARRNLAAL